ncbi:phosphate regulon sensor histidine kinase PhoR [Neptunomonas sp. CHC150]|uniref:phosphate regulon sensor histidine kinase PhoR n=1 Tax=Neptunomonas sp. CHC150 TaxID=2998324 RepID=UPI0025B2592F|nr:phosphate regulon sensor histidine kinase PhoR [Neptunomonas sp. CHC150]MDN2660261.1 phosphate regulon sensor histidine kinase PhoR [Neptunomonas sp. CHC150]
MQRVPQAAVGSLFLFVAVSATVGLFIGSVSWGMVAGLGLWIFLQLRQIGRLQTWLHKYDSEVPEAEGIWGDIFDDLARIKKRHHKQRSDLKEIIKRFQRSSAALPDAVVIIDKHNNLEWWNRAAERLLGFKHVSDRGMPVMNLLRDPRFIRYYHKRKYDDPLQLPSPVLNDTTLQFQIKEFGASDRLLVARDITRLVRLEHTRQDFVANASHELRTPLTVIRGYLETFLDQDLPKPMQRALTQMQAQSSRMEGLVSDLLLLSRLESSQHINDEVPINIHQMLITIHHDAEVISLDKQHQITLDVDSEFDLLGQPQELHSVFSNLVFNAVRYTPEKGLISIKWFVDEQGGHFSVTDNGIGIDSIHLPRLTERFYRVDEGRSTATGGTGLGLAIVKHALYRHGAQLTIESQLGKGSTFICHFPPDMLYSTQSRIAQQKSAT